MKKSLLQYVSIVMILFMINAIIPGQSLAFSEDIRYDFLEDVEGVLSKDYIIAAEHKVVDGQYVMSANHTPNNSVVEQMGFAINPVDFGDGGYYMHVKESWNFSSPVTVSAIHSIVAETKNDTYGTTEKLENVHKTTDNSIKTYDLTKYTGQKEIRRIYNISENSASNVEGSISIDWIVFSKSSTPPSVPVVRENSLFTNSSNKAVRLLVSLGVMKYDEQVETFWEESPVKRGEMAEILCKLYGIEMRENSEQMFYDVDENDRAAIETVALNGYMHGYGNGMFGPDKYVTYAELNKIIVTMLGGSNVAESIGGFPYGYLKVSELLGLKSVGTGSENFVKRIDVANIIYDALHSECLQINSIQGDNIIYDTSDDKTFLSKKLGIYKSQGIMFADNVTSLRTSGGSGDNTVVIGNETLNDPKSLTDGFLGCNVIVYEKRDDESLPGDIIYIEEAKKNKIVDLNADNELSYDEKSRDVFYYLNGENRRKSLTLANAIDFIYNGVAEEFNADVFANNTIDEYRFIDNDNDNKFDVVIMYNYEDYVISKILTEDKEIILKYNESSIRLEENVVRMYREGIPVTLNHLQENQIISVAKSKDIGGNNLYTIRSSETTFEGKVEGISEDDQGRKILQISGAEYVVGDSVTKLVSKNQLTGIRVGDIAKFYQNFMGFISLYELNNNSEEVGFLFRYAIDDEGFTPTIILRIYTDRGKIERLSLSEKVKLDGRTRKTIDLVENDEVLNKLSQKQLVKFKRKDNIITSLELPKDQYDGTNFSKDYSYGTLKCTRTSVFAENVNGKYTAEKYRFAQDTTIFRIPLSGTLSNGSVYEDESLCYVMNGPVIGAGATANLQLYDVMEDGTVSYAIWGYDPDVNRLTSDTALLLVNKVKQEYDSEREEVYNVVSGYGVNGQEVEISLREDCILLDGGNTSEFERGDVIWYVADREGYVQQIKMLNDISKNNSNEISSIDANDWYTIKIRGRVAYKSKNQLSVYISDSAPKNPTEVDGMISNTGTAVYKYEDGYLSQIDFEQIGLHDKVFAVLNRSNQNRILVVYE